MTLKIRSLTASTVGYPSDSWASCYTCTARRSYQQEAI